MPLILTPADEVRARVECLKIAAEHASDPDEVVIAAEKFWLFAIGEEQESEEDDTDRG